MQPGASADIYSLPPSIIKEPSFSFAHNYTRRYGLNSPALNPPGAGPIPSHGAAMAQGPSCLQTERGGHSPASNPLESPWPTVVFLTLGWGLCILAVCVTSLPTSVHIAVFFLLFDSAEPGLPAECLSWLPSACFVGVQTQPVSYRVESCLLDHGLWRCRESDGKCLLSGK